MSRSTPGAPAVVGDRATARAPTASDLEVTSALGFIDSLDLTPLDVDEAGLMDALAATLRRLVAWLRPRSGRAEEGATRVAALTQALAQRPDVARALGEQLLQWVARARCYRAFVGLGLFSRRGFVREVVSRLYERLNPLPRDPADLRDLLATLFDQAGDGAWVSLVPASQWASLHDALTAPVVAELQSRAGSHLSEEALHAIEMLATWIAAEEIDEDLLRLDPVLADIDSAFIALNREIAHCVAEARRQTRADEPTTDPVDAAHAFVVLRQCEAQVDRLRKRAITHGSSLATTHLLERLAQTIQRIDRFLTALTATDGAERRAHAAALFSRLVVASGEQRRLRPLWRRTVRQLALGITEKEGDQGEHYITRDRAGWRSMWRSASGAGVIIALLALVKLQLKAEGWTPLMEALLASLNYGLGFVLVHVLHFTIATKQPAMTASRLAQDIERGDAGRADQRKLARTFVDLVRSQLAAVAGNVSVAMLLAAAIAWAMSWRTGAPLLDAESVTYQLHRLEPIRGGALAFAAIAGVWLFLSGVIAGSIDNRAAYLNLRARLVGHPLLERLIQSAARRERIAVYVHTHYGAIAGNFLFGVLLGMTPWVGIVLGIPFDIRHVAFSSADLGFAAASGAIGWGAFLLHLGYVLLIGGVNLAVSFWLALWLALRARATQLGSLPALAARFAEQVWAAPRLLLLPPRDPPQ